MATSNSGDCLATLHCNSNQNTAINSPSPRGSGRRATRVRVSNFNLSNNNGNNGNGPRIVTGNNFNLPEFNSHPGVLYDESALTESPVSAALVGHDHSHSGHDHIRMMDMITAMVKRFQRRFNHCQQEGQHREGGSNRSQASSVLRSSDDRSANPINALISLPPPNLIPRDGPSIIRIIDTSRPLDNGRGNDGRQNGDNRSSGRVNNNWSSSGSLGTTREAVTASSPRPFPPRPSEWTTKGSSHCSSPCTRVQWKSMELANTGTNWNTSGPVILFLIHGQGGQSTPTVTTSNPFIGPNTIHFSNIPSRGRTTLNNGNQLTTRSPVTSLNSPANNAHDHNHHVDGHYDNRNDNPFNDEVFVTEFPYYDNYNTVPPTTTTTSTTQAPITTTVPTTTRSWTTARSLPSTRGFSDQDLVNHWSLVTDGGNHDRSRVTSSPTALLTNANSGRSRSRSRDQVPVVTPTARPTSAPTSTTPRSSRLRDEVDPSSELVDPSSPPVAMGNGGIVACTRRGVYAHPQSCGQFVVCAPLTRGSTKYRSYEHHCPAEQVFVEEVGRCRPGNKEKCEVYT